MKRELKVRNLEAIQDLAEDLDRNFESWSDVRPSALCDAVEAYLFEKLRRHIVKYFSETATQQGKSFSAVGNEGFTLEDTVYIVELSPRRTALLIEIRPVDATSREMVRRAERTHFSSPGRYNEVQTRVGLLLKDHRQQLCEDCAAILQGGYRWLEQQVLTSLGRFRDDIAEDLYLLVRKSLPDSVTDNLWFFVITGENSFYLPDRHSLDVALSRAKRRFIQTLESPLEIISQFVDTNLVIDDTCSKEALVSNQVLSQDVQKAKYSTTGFQIAERAIYDCRGIWVHPLVSEGKAMLTVGYPAHPADLREKLYTALERLKPKFKEELECKSKLFQRLMADIKNQRALPQTAGSLAYIAGRFLQGLGDLPSVGK